MLLLGGGKIKRNFIFVVVLLLGFTLALGMGAISATNTTKATTNTTQSVTSVTSSNTGHGEGTVATTTTKTIKVLIYSGKYSIGSCVTGIKTGLNTANSKHLVPGYKFTYATSTTITSSKLKGYDVLAMPGGTDGDYYVYSKSISSTAIKNFVSSGKGYLGICAGAYSGVKSVKGYYKAWGVAPHVVSTRPWVEGNVGVKIEAAGQTLFKRSGTITMAHYNGPAMFSSGADIVTFATYADNKAKSKGLGAIVGDYYGKGRSVIVGPHPELVPKQPGILANLVVWAAHKDTLTSSLYNKVTKAQIATTASTVKTYYTKHKALPSSVTIGGYKVSMPQFAYILTRGITNVQSGSTASIGVNPMGFAPKESGKYKSGSISKNNYLKYAKSLISFMNSNGRAPNFQTTTLGKISFTKMVLVYIKVMDYYNLHKRLPSSVAV